MKKKTEQGSALPADTKLDRLEIYSLTARGLLLALALFAAYSIVSNFVG